MTNNLSTIPTIAPLGLEKQNIRLETKKLLLQLRDLQKVLYAQSKYSVLIVLQGLDAAGKDGAVREIFSGLNPLGCSVKAFKAPSKEERSYDFLWRVHKHVPPKGMIHIFNRSHYEDVLVPKVEGWINHEEVQRRFSHINNFERLVASNNTIIFKFYLHISKERQKERLQDRLVNPLKYWKHNDEDWDTAAKFDAYLEAYEDIFLNCSSVAPWEIVPSDKNWYKEYIIASKIVEKLGKLDLEYPQLISENFGKNK